MQNELHSGPVESTMPHGSNEYLTFRLGEEHYALDILKVQEIRAYERPTALANAPAFIKGVVNLRGTIVPIMDLRIRFDLASASYDSFTVVIILNIAERIVGIVVDGVSDVVGIGPEQMCATPEFSGSFDVSHIKGLAKVDERMLIVVDIDTVITAGELAAEAGAGRLAA